MERRSRQSILASLRNVMPPLLRSSKASKSLKDCSPTSHDLWRTISDCPSPELDESQTPSMNTVKSARSALCTGNLGKSESCLGQIDSSLYELIPGKLYITFHPNQAYTKQDIKRHPEFFFMSTNCHESYAPFAKDFGPVNIGVICRFALSLRSRANNPDLRGRPIVYYTSCNVKHQTNAVLLLAMYIMMEHGYSADAAALCFREIPEYPFLPFCDASDEPDDFGLTLHDCLAGFEKAVSVGWFDEQTFDLRGYELMSHRGGGDMCVFGNKFVATRSPQQGPLHSTHNSIFYVRRFLQMGVSTVIRLNEASSYDAAQFTDAGIAVVDLHFEDGGCPSSEVAKKFLDVCDSAEGLVAVHCQSGLGKTGTLIGMWMVKNLHMSARESIAWIRMLRPGSVVGVQKHFLQACETVRWDGNKMLQRLTLPRSKSWPLTAGWRGDRKSVV